MAILVSQRARGQNRESPNMTHFSPSTGTCRSTGSVKVDGDICKLFLHVV